MKSTPSILLLATAAMIAIGTAGPALAADVCNVPAAKAQSTDALKAQLEKDGWTIRKIKHQKGCYEAYAVKGSARMEKLFDPATLKMLDVAAD
ncbi:Peptidase propeptide and YPEB domain-containing protein [Kaistia soli DSM 19436]|uniref:Peptidase propeptide and YPEB domain-containing protein n=1 Tax=Kaistia soli DSM 19436 TaxID=1122133 RepID=A0A1M4YWY6_9HYPH|nr:PepSY domain-containing protein [Kaistia soli]SHF10067.1 Peptidase propeptide and YPEB domain-containing protein [Kaistia soli DSM 19436]